MDCSGVALVTPALFAKIVLKLAIAGCGVSMQFKIPKNDSKYHWTQHSIRKMLFYSLTADRIKRIIINPKRVENGVAENTVSAMIPGANKKKPSEVWTMYQQKGSRKIIISAWRYPGVSPIGKQIPIPADILEELKKEGIVI
ncbi:MAG: hypothetical protein HY505_03030 [Candidatus Yanofskybacteria bacterium]|nr:hypothetical protein [Candidatus Yanofskybacteria bacterium]